MNTRGYLANGVATSLTKWTNRTDGFHLGVVPFVKYRELNLGYRSLFLPRVLQLFIWRVILARADEFHHVRQGERGVLYFGEQGLVFVEIVGERIRGRS